MVQKTLQMIFSTAGGSTASISLPAPRTDLLPSEVESVMQLIITNSIFTSTSGDLVDISAARIISRETTDLLGA